MKFPFFYMNKIRKPLKEIENLNINYEEMTKVLQREIFLQKKREWDKYSDELLLSMKKRENKNKHLIQMLKEYKQDQDVYFTNLFNSITWKYDKEN